MSISRPYQIFADQEQKLKFGLHNEETWLQNPTCSSRIYNLNSFWRTMAQNPSRGSQVMRVSLGWHITAANDVADAAKMLLWHLSNSLNSLHLMPSQFDVSLLVGYPVTSLDIPVSSMELFFVDSHSIKDKLYQAFTIPTLRHLTLRGCRSWGALRPSSSAETKQARTSSVVSLAVFNTVPPQDLALCQRFCLGLRRRSIFTMIMR
jgi:hypothetical protein